MRKHVFWFAAVYFLIFSSPVFAQSVTPNPTPGSSFSTDIFTLSGFPTTPDQVLTILFDPSGNQIANEPNGWAGGNVNLTDTLSNIFNNSSSFGGIQNDVCGTYNIVDLNIDTSNTSCSNSSVAGAYSACAGDVGFIDDTPLVVDGCAPPPPPPPPAPVGAANCAYDDIGSSTAACMYPTYEDWLAMNLMFLFCLSFLPLTFFFRRFNMKRKDF